MSLRVGIPSRRGFLAEPRRRVRVAIAIGLSVFTLLSLAPQEAHSLPPGRAWAPVDTFKVPGHTWMLPLYMSRDSTGNPIMFAEPRDGIGADTGRYDWRDSTWVSRWLLGYGVLAIWPDISPPHQEWLLWKNTDDQTPPDYIQSTLVLAEDLRGSLGALDTVTLVYEGTGNYVVAASERRRWVAIADRTGPRLGGDLRLLYSDTLKVWHEVNVTGLGDGGVALGVLNDTSAVLVWAGAREGMRWGVLRGSLWESSGEQLTTSQLAEFPHLRRHPRGGYWLTYVDFIDGDIRRLKLLRYLDGTWTRVDSVACAFTRSTDQYIYQVPSLSMDDAEYPSIAWSGFSTVIGVETICACMSTDSGFMTGDNIQPSDGGFLPGITRDPNGDVWISWWKYYDGMFWTHTYETATTSTPRIVPLGSRRAIQWDLSEPSPETWWAVLRSRNDAPFEVAARVRATPDTAMAWIDDSPPAGTLRYKIRRECVDVRYRWESTEARWPLRNRRPFRFKVVPSPLAETSEVELSGAAAGVLDIAVYDLQGRVVLTQRVEGSGSGVDRFRLDLTRTSSRLSSGVYFLRARDIGGNLSDASKLVILR